MTAEHTTVIVDAHWYHKTFDCNSGTVEKMSYRSESETSTLSHESQGHTFYFWDACLWQKVPVTTNKLLSKAYKTRKDKIVVAAGMAQLYEIDFENKVQKNMKTGFIQSLAWECHTTGSRVGFDTPINGEKQEPVPGQDFACIRLMMSPTSEKNLDLHDAETSPTKSSSNSSMCNRILTGSSASSQSNARREFSYEIREKVAYLEPRSPEIQPQRPSRAFRRLNSNRTTPYPLFKGPPRDAKVVDKLFHPSDPRTRSKLQWLNILASPTTPTGVLPSLPSPSAVLQKDLNVLSMLCPPPRVASGANRLDIPS